MFRKLVMVVALLVAMWGLAPHGVAYASGNPTQAHASKSGTVSPMTTGPCYNSPSDANCNGQDPINQGCTADAVPQGTDIIVYPSDKITLYWSPHCKTNWATFAANNSGDLVESAYIMRSPNSASYCNSLPLFGSGSCPVNLSYVYTPNTKTWYTDMVYAPTSATHGCGMFGTNSASTYGCGQWH